MASRIELARRALLGAVATSSLMLPLPAVAETSANSALPNSGNAQSPAPAPRPTGSSSPTAEPAKKQQEKGSASSPAVARDSVENKDVNSAADEAAAAEAAAAQDTIIITGQRQALETATELKRASDTISDSIVLDEAGKVPSTSLLETLERVPGVAMNRIRAGNQGSPDGFTFEGSGIQVRGLTGTKTLVNGQEVFSANGGNGLSYSDIGPELLKSVTVYKASRADLIEGGIAATVDLRTHMPFDSKGTNVAGSISGSYGDFSDDITPSASIRASTRFDTPLGEFGILANLAYSKIKSYDSNYLVRPYFPTLHNGNTVYAPAGFSATNDQFERTRKGFYGAFQWRPTPELEFYHSTFISAWDSKRNTQLMVLDQPAVGVTADSEFDDGVFVRGGITNRAAPATGIAVASNASFTPSHSKVSNFSQGFKYLSDRLEVSGNYQYVEATSGFSKYGIGLAGRGVVQTNIDTVGSIPDISFETPFTADPATTAVSNFAWLTQDNKSHSNTWQLDAAYDVGDGFFKKVAVGGRIARRQESDNFVGTWWSASAKGWNGVPTVFVARAPEGDFVLEEFSNFFNGEIDAPASVFVPAASTTQGHQFERVVNTYAACAPDLTFKCSVPTRSTYLYGNPPDPNFGTQPSFSTTKPDVDSVYAMLGFGNSSDSPFLNFSGNIGVRWVQYSAESEGNYVFAGNKNYYRNLADAEASLAQIGGFANLRAWQLANPGQRLPLSLTSVADSSQRTGSFSNDYFMPSFNIKFEPTRGLLLRYALTKTLTPPSFNDIRAQGNASVFTTPNPFGTGLPEIFAGYSYSSGDPRLKPQIAWNNDISIEWYPKRGTSMHLALFHKSIKNAILFHEFSGTASEFFASEDLPMSAPADGGAASFIDGPIVGKGNINADGNATIKGFEIGGQTYFDMLPGILRGFGIDANLTYIDGRSPDALALDMTGSRLSVPLIGLSKWNYSATLLYDLNKFSARLAWTWRSRYLATTSDASTSGTYTDPVSRRLVSFGLPVYAAAAGRLSGSIGYEISDRFNIRLSVENITNAKQRTEMEILPGRFVQRGVFVTDRRTSLRLSFRF
jgi:TonB-dependent receptor